VGYCQNLAVIAPCNLPSRTLKSVNFTLPHPFYHLLNGSARIVVKTVRSVNGFRPELTPLLIRNPFTDHNQTQHNSLRSGNSLKVKTHHHPTKRAPPTNGPHISFLLVFFFIFFFICFVRFLSPRPAKTARPISTIYTSNDAVTHKEVTLGGPTLPKTSNGFIFQKN
jgi:hypothetical protein